MEHNVKRSQKVTITTTKFKNKCSQVTSMCRCQDKANGCHSSSGEKTTVFDAAMGGSPCLPHKNISDTITQCSQVSVGLHKLLLVNGKMIGKIWLEVNEAARVLLNSLACTQDTGARCPGQYQTRAGVWHHNTRHALQARDQGEVRTHNEGAYEGHSATVAWH